MPGLTEYKLGSAFPGVMGRAVAQSEPAWLKPKRAKEGTPVGPFYQSPFEFTGTVHSVTFDVSGDGIEDKEAEMRMIMARQ